MLTAFFVLTMVLLVIMVWALLGFIIIREDERGVKIFFGDPYSVVESGLRWIAWPFVKISRYSTGVVELGSKKTSDPKNENLEFRRARIFTKKGKSLDASDPEEYGPANVGADVSFRFFWPKNKDRLINVVKILPSPDDFEALTDIFEETVLEHVRTVGSQRTWTDLARDRAGFAKDIMESIDSNNLKGIIDDVENPVVVIDHLEIPEELLNSIQKQEVARLKKAATIIDAEAESRRLALEGEGNKAKKEKEGEGDAYARQKLFEAIGNEPENIRKETLLTLREMAKGTSNTIFFPTRVGEILEDVFGGKKFAGPVDFGKFISELSDSNRSALAKILAEVKKGGA